MSVIDPSHIDNVLTLFDGREFTTLEFIVDFRERNPDDWRLLVATYGNGGAGGGTYYSANSYIALRLNDRRYRGTITLVGYDNAPKGWGHPQIARWRLGGAEMQAAA